MASYSTRQRDPLLDSDMQAAIEKRSKELLGLGLVIAGVMSAMIIGSYSPDDPNWMLATDAPVNNWLGRFGASIAAPLVMIVGKGAWGLALGLIVWGIRFMAHLGGERAFGRVIFGPIAVAVASVYCATLTPAEGWTNTFGVGGLFGDTVLGILLTLVPVSTIVSVKLVSVVMGILMLALGGFVLGFTRPELRSIRQLAMYGSVVVYSLALRLMGRGAEASFRMAQGVHANVQARRETARQEREYYRQETDAFYSVPEPDMKQRVASVIRANPNRPVEVPDYDDMDEQADMPTMFNQHPAPSQKRIARRAAEVQHDYEAERSHAPAPVAPQRHPEPEYHYEEPRQASGGLFGLMPKMLRRQPEVMPYPELIEVEPPIYTDAPVPQDEDRIKSRTSDAIRRRSGAPEPVAAPVPPVTRTAEGLRLEPTLMHGKGPRPLLVPQAAALRADARYPSAAPARQERAEPMLARTEPPLARITVPEVRTPVAPVVEEDTYDTEETTPLAEEPRVAPRLQMPSAWDDMDEADLLVDEDNIFADAVDLSSADAPRPRMAPPAPVIADKRGVVQHNLKRPVVPSKQARIEAQPALQFEESAHHYETPPLHLLMDPTEIERHHLSDEALEENARMLESVLDDYGIKGEIVSVRPGPVVTMYELEPAPGLKASRVIGLADDIARSMSALSARVSTVPGRSVIGIELPNANREKVVLREILAARDFGDSNMRLPLALGKDIGGDAVVANLAKMPHLLIAGTTGSGKSVAINTMILSLLYKLTPDECRLIMIDPKMLELSVYDGIPHLLSPVVTDPKKAVVALKWVVGEMEERYRKMSKMGVRNIEGYNGRVRDALARGEMFERTVQTGFDEETGDPIFETEELKPVSLPYIVVIVDEMADLMMVAGKEIEACIQRLAQMARASGIHLIMATQRPSVDVITGTIKANFPTRISFQVTSKIDSRTILGEQGAEQLLGMGDMLYMAGGAKITRVHGPFVSDEEVEEIVNYLKGFGPPEYMSGVVDGPDDDKADEIDQVLGLGGNTDSEDSLYDQAVAIVIKDRKCSTSYIQRKLAIGYNKAARLVEQMEDEGVVSSANHVGKREILVPEQH